jgi:hypothetical protein
MGGLEKIVAEDGSVTPGSKVGVDTIRCAAAAVPLILKYQGTGKIHAVGQEENVKEQWLDSLDGWLGHVQFGSSGQPMHFGKDWRHSGDGYSQTAAAMAKDGADGNRGRGLVIQASTHEFYFVGANYRISLRPKPLTDEMRSQLMRNNSEPGRYVSVEEGHFDRKGEFIVDRTRNGDVIGSGLWVEPDIEVLRVITCY